MLAGFDEAFFGFEREGSNGAKGGFVVARKLFDVAMKLLLETKEAGGFVKGGINAVKVEAGDLLSKRAFNGLI